MDDKNILWSDIIKVLRPTWLQLSKREGSFYDGPFEQTKDFTKVLDAIAPMEQEAHTALNYWIEHREMPNVSPAANRYLELKFICGIGFLENLSAIGSEGPPNSMKVEDTLKWVLSEVQADTIQVALDNLRSDLAGATV